MPKWPFRSVVRARGMLVVLSGILLALAVGMVSGLQTPRPLARAVLPDGSILTLEGVTHGHGLHYLHLGTQFQRWLGAHVDPEVGRFLHLERWVFTAYPPDQDPDRLLLWTQLRTPVPPRGLMRGDRHPLRPVLVDDQGISYPDQSAETRAETDVWRKMFMWSVWPHRSRSLRILVYDAGPGSATAKPVADWVIPNPHPIQTPVWTASPLPVRSSAGPLEVTLNRLERLRAHSDTTPGIVPQRDGLRASFHVTENGKPAPEWQILEVQLVDPTGNTRAWGRPPNARYSVSPAGELLAEAANVVPPNEATVRLRVLLARKEDLQYQVTLDRLPVSWDGPEVVKLNRTVYLSGRPVQLLQISHLQQGTTLGYPFTLEYALPERPPIAVNAVKAVDSSGRPVGLYAISWSTPDLCVLGMRPLPDARFVNLTITRSLDFVPAERCREATFTVAIPPG